MYLSLVGGELIWLKIEACGQAFAAGQKPPVVLIGKLREIGNSGLGRCVMACRCINRYQRLGGLFDAIPTFHGIAGSGGNSIIRMDFHRTG